MLHASCSKFSQLSRPNGENFLKIFQQLTKLPSATQCLPFLGHPVGLDLWNSHCKTIWNQLWILNWVESEIHCHVFWTTVNIKKVKLDLYSEKLASEALKRSGMDHTVFTLQLGLHHTCLYLVKHSPDGATTDSEQPSDCSLLLIYRPQEVEDETCPVPV